MFGYDDKKETGIESDGSPKDKMTNAMNDFLKSLKILQNKNIL